MWLMEFNVNFISPSVSYYLMQAYTLSFINYIYVRSSVFPVDEKV